MTPKQRAEEAAVESTPTRYDEHGNENEDGLLVFYSDYLEREAELRRSLRDMIDLEKSALLAQQAEHEAEIQRLCRALSGTQDALKLERAERDAAVEALAAWKAAAVDDSDAAVAEAVERAAKIIEVEIDRRINDKEHPCGADFWCTEIDALETVLMTIRALKPSSDMVSVPREPTPKQWQDFYERVWDSDESNPMLALQKAELQRIGRAMLAAAEANK